jgi:hypothetical protein
MLMAANVPAQAFDLLEEVMDHELPFAKPLLASMVHLALEASRGSFPWASFSAAWSLT